MNYKKMIKKNKIKNDYFNRKLLNEEKSIILETIHNKKVKYFQQLNIMGEIDIFDLNGNIIILNINKNEKYTTI